MPRIVPLALAACLGWTPQVQRDGALPSAPTGTAAIAGRVLIDAGGSPQPVRRARLTLESEALSKPQTTDTDIEGRYRFGNLPAGSYYVRAEKAGFVRSCAICAERSNDRRPWSCRPPRLRSKISGWFAAPRSKAESCWTPVRPAVNVVVSAVRFAYDANGRRPVAVRQRGRMIVAGFACTPCQRARLPRRRTGPARRPATAPARPAAPQRPSRARTTRALRALKVDRPSRSQPAQDLSALNFTLSTVPTVALNGRIVSSTGAPANAIAPRIQRVGGPVGEVRDIHSRPK